MSLSVTEEWRPVFGYEKYYQVSSAGRVKSLDRVVNGKNNKPRMSYGRILRPKVDRKGYACIVMCVGNIRKYIQIHVLVAQSFLPPCPGKHGNKKGEYQIDHIDNNSLNNFYTNLQWLSTKDHHQKTCSLEYGTPCVGEKSGNSKFTEDQVQRIRNDYRSYSEIARDYNVSHFAIDAIISNKTWKHLPYPNYVEQTNYRKENKYKLNKDSVISIYLDTRSINTIALEYGVTPGTIYHIKRKHTWKGITKDL